MKADEAKRLRQLEVENARHRFHTRAAELEAILVKLPTDRCGGGTLPGTRFHGWGASPAVEENASARRCTSS